MGNDLPMHYIPGTENKYQCEDCYLADKINRWWLVNKPTRMSEQMQEYPLGRIRPTPYFEFSKVVA
jgi:hypothetical protein